MASDAPGHDLQLELQPTRQRVATDPHEATNGPQQHLQPVDGGRAAWTVLMAGFVFESLFWGFPSSFGIFQQYYSTIPEFQADSEDIALIGTLAQSLFYLGAPFAAFATTIFPKYQRQQIWIGWFLAISGLTFASFASSVKGLIATQGFLYGLGFVTLTYPIVGMINEWWVARKGMAFGLISASSGLTGAALPFILEILLRKYGYRTTLRACGVAMAILTFPLLFLFKSRLPVSPESTLKRTNWTFLRRPLFWVYVATTLIQGLGFFMPAVFLPTYAASLGLAPINGSLLIALMSIAQVLGQFAFGSLSDKKLSVSLLAGICCVAASASAFLLWGLSTSMATLIPFSLLYGFFGFGFGTMRVAMGRAVVDDPSSIFATYEAFVFVQGVGNILVGPVSARLIEGDVEVEGFGIGRFAGLVGLTGATSVCAAVVLGGWHGVRWLKGGGV